MAWFGEPSPEGRLVADPDDRPTSDPQYCLTTDLLVHHIATLATGVFCLKAGGPHRPFGRGRFLVQGCRLAATEMTTALPVAFRQALRNKKFKGPKRYVFVAVMPAAFIWRTAQSWSVLRAAWAKVQVSPES